MRIFVLAAAVLAMVLVENASAARWTVALPGTPRAQQIRSMDIMSRPNRPLHFYGNIVRRSNGA
jgi:hypothetical protein